MYEHVKKMTYMYIFCACAVVHCAHAHVAFCEKLDPRKNIGTKRYLSVVLSCLSRHLVE